MGIADPRITVLMPVYNGARFLREAIESILSQTFRDFEFLIVNDGSTDASSDIIGAYSDSRIRLVQNDMNLGLIASLNKGIELAQSEYIARMDCDDISMLDRLARQLAFMDAHPKVGVCGSWARLIDDRGNITGKRRTPAGYAAGKLCWRPSPFMHSTCMIRTGLLKADRYSPEYLHAEDYELWQRLSRKTGLYNLDRYLLLYRMHPDSISGSLKKTQLENSYKAFQAHIAIPKIDYPGFLSLVPAEAKINPLRRAYYLWLACAGFGGNIFWFIFDNLIYLRLWLRSY